MSHFTHLKTRFQNLAYLEKALNRLKIEHKQQENTLPKSNLSNVHLIIPQTNGYNLEFAWNGEEYEMIVDLSFWEQSSPIESFINKIAQEYAGEVIIGESQKMGFQPIQYDPNIDGSKTLILERWNNKN